MTREEDWDFYRCNVNDQVSSVYTDMELVNAAPIDYLPILHWLWIRLRFADDRGLSTDEEFDSLCSYEDELCRTLLKSDDVVFVGRITGAGRREFYFYTTEKFDFDHQVDEVLSNRSEYQYQIGSKRDADWKQYLDLLYPGEHGLEQIKRRRESPA